MSENRMYSEHRWIYIGAIVVLVLMVIIGLVTFRSVHASNQANQKAQQLDEALVAAGYPSIDQTEAARLLGTDGGALCNDPESALKHGLWLVDMSNGAGGPGQRPIIADLRALQAGAIVVKVYCPDNLEAYQQKINDLKTGNTIR